MTRSAYAILAACALLLSACADDPVAMSVSAPSVALNGGGVTGLTDVLQLNSPAARDVLGQSAQNAISSQLRYNTAEQTAKNITHRAEYIEPTAPPLDTSVEYAWRVFLPQTFPVSRLSVTTAAWYDHTDNSILQQIVALNQLWIEFQASPRHEQVYKPHPAGACVRGQVHTMTASLVWSTNPDKGRIQLWCDNKELFRYRGATLASGTKVAPRFAVGLSYRGSGRGVGTIGDAQQAYYGDLRRRVGAVATVLPPPPPLSLARLKSTDPAFNAIPLPRFEVLPPL